MVKAIRYRVVSKYLAGALIVISLFLAFTALTTPILGEGRYAIHFLLPSLLFSIIGIRVYRGIPERDVTEIEGVAILTLSFPLAGIAGMLPYISTGIMPPLDAFFESISGFTTTGFTLIDLARTPRSILLWRSLTQWIGGMGFIIMSIGMLLVSERAVVQLFSVGGSDTRLLPRVVHHVRIIIFTYSILTILGILFLLLLGLSPFDAIALTFSGISTGGFSTHPEGIGAFQVDRVSMAFILLMLLGAIDFVIYYRLRKASPSLWAMVRGFFRDPQVLYLSIVTPLLGLSLNLLLGMEWYDGFFLAVSAHTTTGYSTFDTSSLPPEAKALLLPAMFIGGSFGSTAGGIKVFRFLVLFRGLALESSRPAYPRGTIVPLKFMGKVVSHEDLTHLFYIFMAYLVAVVAGTILFILHHYDPMDSIFEVTSGVGTVGLSAGIVSPSMAWDLKVFLILLMWMGRIEVLPLIIWVHSFRFLARRRR